MVARRRSAVEPDPAPIDVSLLEGVAFQCRPDCGLCCYTTPAVEPEERRRLIRLDPEIPWIEGTGPWSFIGSQGDGGACHFLSGSKCRAYDQRPFCCREFPLSVHLGIRAQATAVLSCPGVGVSGWGADQGRAHPLGAPRGLDAELASVEREYRRGGAAGRLRDARRRWSNVARRASGTGRWSDPADILDEVGPRAVVLARSRYPPPPPPPRSDDVEYLPLWFDPRHGRVALAEHRGQWEVLAVREDGGPTRTLGAWHLAERPRALAEDGESVLASYLDLLLRRDFTYWAAAERIRSGSRSSLLEEVEADVAAFGARVLARADIAERLGTDRAGPLDGEAVWQGVRATDGEFLDRQTLGWVL